MFNEFYIHTLKQYNSSCNTILYFYGRGDQMNDEEKLIPKVEKPLKEINKILPIETKAKISRTLDEIMHKKTLSVFSDLLSGQEIGKEIISVINKDTVYIAKIPKELEEGMNLGILDFMKDSKTGENIGTIVSKKHRIKGTVNIEKIDKAALSQQELSTNLANLAMQQQLAHMTEILEDIQAKVIAIQEGQDAELFGRMKGMRNQLLQVQKTKKEDNRKQLTTQAITELNAIRGSIEEKLKLELQKFPYVPDSDNKIRWEITKNKNYLSSAVNSYNRIEELFKYYMDSTLLLGYAYLFLDEPDSFDIIFIPDQELVKHEKLENLIAAESLFAENFGITWYKNPEQFLLKLKEETQNLFHETNDYIQIEITGTQLLEVIEHGARKNNHKNRKTKIPCGR